MANSGLGLFINQFWRQYHTTGAIWPSGVVLGRELAYYLSHDSSAKSANDGRRILEVGPGTGTITAAIIAAMQPNDTLTLVEVNPEFVTHLQKRLETEPTWQAVAARTTIVTKLIQDFQVDEPFDHIVSGLPLNNFEVEVVRMILNCFERLAKSGGTVSFFEYIAIRHFKAVVSSATTRQRLRGIDQALKAFFGDREIRRAAVWRNLPPAWAHHVQIGG